MLVCSGCRREIRSEHEVVYVVIHLTIHPACTSCAQLTYRRLKRALDQLGLPA